jgi:hypothetical protein
VPYQDARVEPLSRVDWLRALQSLPDHPFFVTPRFLDSWSRHHAAGSRAVAWRVEDATGGWRLCTWVETRTSRFGTRGLIAPEGGYGTAGHGSIAPSAIEHLLRSLQQHRTDTIEVVLGPHEEARPAHKLGFECVPMDAWIVDLRQHQDRISPGVDKRVRRQLRLCDAAGVQTQRHGIEGLDEFYLLYRRALAQHSRPVEYSKAFLRDLLTADGPGEACLYLTRHRRQLISGGLLLVGGAHALAWIGCYDRAAANLHGNLHRHCTVIGDLAHRGFAAYNLGAAPSLPQVASFKQKLGATPRPYHVLTWRNPMLRKVRQILRRSP